jgi:coiled-coil domain-containing protein 130
MSSLSATQADGYYVPPEYYDSGQYKKQTKNPLGGSKGHNQYLQHGVVRFELPYKGVCQGCHTSIGRGTRYNAKRIKTDKSYFTSPILEFQLACRKCQHPWVIRTNPKERGFDYVEGVSIQAGQEESDVLDISSTLTLTPTDNKQPSDALARLESVARGKRETRTEIEKLERLQNINANTTLPDAAWNATIRSRFRKDRNEKRDRLHQASQVGWREGMELLATTIDDKVTSKDTIFGKDRHDEHQRWAKVRKASIFGLNDKKGKRRRRSIEEPTPVVSSSSNARLSSSSNAPPASSSSESAPRTKRKIQAALLSSTTTTTPPTKATKVSNPKSNSLGDMLAAYGSDSEEG